MADTLQGTPITPTRPKEPVTCPDCGTRFSRKPDLDRHLKPKVACLVGGCHRAFRTDKYNDFMKHVEKKHPGVDSQLAKGHFKDHKDVSAPVPGICAPGGPQRPVAEPQVIQTPAQQPLFSAMPAHNGSLDSVGPNHDLGLLSNIYNTDMQSFGSYTPSTWQSTMNVDPSLGIEDPSLRAQIFDPSLTDIYRWPGFSSPAGSRFTLPK